MFCFQIISSFSLNQKQNNSYISPWEIRIGVTSLLLFIYIFVNIFLIVMPFVFNTHIVLNETEIRRSTLIIIYKIWDIKSPGANPLLAFWREKQQCVLNKITETNMPTDYEGLCMVPVFFLFCKLWFQCEKRPNNVRTHCALYKIHRKHGVRVQSLTGTAKRCVCAF